MKKRFITIMLALCLAVFGCFFVGCSEKASSDDEKKEEQQITDEKKDEDTEKRYDDPNDDGNWSGWQK